MCADADFKNRDIDCDVTSVTYSGKDMFEYYTSFTEIIRDCNRANPRDADQGCAAKT